MKKAIFRNCKSNKKAFVFAILDFWSILFFVAVIIILLIYVNFAKERDKENIDSNIVGVNFPHYFMNIFQSEKINLSEYNSDCPITQKMTRIEILQYFNSNNELISQTNDVCVDAFTSSCSTIGDLTIIGTSQVVTLFSQDVSNFGITKFKGKATLPSLSNRLIEFKDSFESFEKFSFEIPSEEGQIKINIYYKND